MKQKSAIQPPVNIQLRPSMKTTDLDVFFDLLVSIIRRQATQEDRDQTQTQHLDQKKAA